MFFKTRDYYHKQKPIRHNPENGDIVQTFHWEIDPKILTGINKEELISKTGMFKEGYSQNSPKRLIPESKTMLFSGFFNFWSHDNLDFPFSWKES